MPDRSSYVSIAMSLVGIVENKLANSTAQRIRFVYPLTILLSLFFLVQKERWFAPAFENADAFWLSMIGDHDSRGARHV